MSTMGGSFCPEQEMILYSKHLKEERKNISRLPVEYIWKLLSFLPPIPDVPPPVAKNAFSEFLRNPGLEAAKRRIAHLIEKEGRKSLSES